MVESVMNGSDSRPIGILAVIGTRPEAIKMAPVIMELSRRNAGRARPKFDVQVCSTGQHRELLDQVLDLFSLTVNHSLKIMRPGQTLDHVTSEVLTGVGRILDASKPDWVLVQGDTTTAMAASLAAFYRHIRVGHVEAGLRTGDRQHPFPEEVNRRIIDLMADLYFAPTGESRQHLLREGVQAGSVLLTGNTVIDALKHVAERTFDHVEQSLQAIGLWASRIVLVTAHRRENFGEPFRRIVAALAELSARFPDVQFVYPMHPNPNVRAACEFLKGKRNVSLTEPLDYAVLVHLMKRSTIVITDSGGIQEEAPGLGKPVLVLRERSERPEGIAAGTAKLVGTDSERIVAEASSLLNDPKAYARMANSVNPYGDGTASIQIVDALEKWGTDPAETH